MLTRPRCQLGVLDFGMLAQSQPAGETMRDSCRLAVLAESLGYSRYWLAEHHEAYFAWAAPEVLLPVIAETTTRIRIGAAGFLMHFYSPLKIAEIGRMFQALYPGRFDLGLAAGISEDITRQALVPGFDLEAARATRLFGRKVSELLDFLRNRFPPGHRFERGATPVGRYCPDVWLMGSGSGRGSMILAASQGTCYSHSLFHGDAVADPEVMRQYEDTFQPSAEVSNPHANLAITIVCSEREDAARRQLKAIEMGVRVPVNVCGNPGQCGEQIQDLMRRFGVDECVLVPVWASFSDRAATYQLLAEVFDLTNAPITEAAVRVG